MAYFEEFATEGALFKLILPKQSKTSQSKMQIESEAHLL